MKFAVASFLLALAVAQGATNAVSPIGKVLQMISDLQSKVIKEGDETQKLYEEFSEWCEDRSKDLGFEIKTGKSEVESLKAAIAEEVSTASSLNTKIEELTASIATNDADLKAATGIREKENKDFIAEEKELMEVIDTLERASGIIEREMAKGGAAMLQMKNVGSVTQAISIMLQASAIGSADAQKLTALVQSSSNSDMEDMDMALGAPAAAAYEGHSGGILDTLADLSEKAQTQLDAARKKETTAVHNFEMLKQSLEDEMKYANKDLDEAKKGLAASAEKKATAEGDLETTSKDLATDIEAKGELHHDCMTKAQDFEAETKSRGEELSALAEAKKIISEMTGGAEEVSYGSASFLQTASKLSSGADLANFEVVRFVRDLAKKQHAPALTQLASRMAAAVRFGHRTGADPFEKVKSLIGDMITKLESEAAESASKKAYCDKEMAETTAKKELKSDEVESLSTKIDQMTAQSAKLKEEVSALQNALSKLASSQAEMDKLRQEESAVYKKNKAELDEGLEGVKKALAVLKEYYAKKDQAHSSAEGASSGIIGILEVCESDFSKDLAEIVSTEETAASAYEEETKENDVEKMMKEQDVKYKTKEAASLDKAVAETTSDLNGVQAELDAVLEYDEKIKAECIAKAESYEERTKRREAEISGLKEALSILENESALLQEHSVRKALRGVRAHVQ